jgi:hypothetical protein
VRTIEPALWDVLRPAHPGRLLFGFPFHTVASPLFIQAPWVIRGALLAFGQLVLPLLFVTWVVFGGKPAAAAPWIAIGGVFGAVAGALTNVHAVRRMIAHHLANE